MNLSNRKPQFRLLSLAGVLLASAAMSQASVQTPKKILMWKAVNGANVVYLLGSIHLGSNDMYPLPKVIDQAFAASKAMVVEIDITKVDQASTQSYIMQAGMYQGDDTLWNHISKPTEELVKKFFADNGMPDSFASKMKPWLAGVMGSVLPMMKAGMDPNLGIDKHFLDLAKGKKKIEEAESVDFQLKLLSSLPENLSDKYLSWTISEASKIKDEDLKIEKLWKAGDPDALNSAVSAHPKELDGVMRQLLEDRNPHMADIAEKYLKNGGGPCFFVVGAAHLIGKEGVVALLQKRGYTVYQLSSP